MVPCVRPDGHLGVAALPALGDRGDGLVSEPPIRTSHPSKQRAEDEPDSQRSERAGPWRACSRCLLSPFTQMGAAAASGRRPSALSIVLLRSSCCCPGHEGSPSSPSLSSRSRLRQASSILPPPAGPSQRHLGCQESQLPQLLSRRAMSTRSELAGRLGLSVLPAGRAGGARCRPCPLSPSSFVMGAGRPDACSSSAAGAMQRSASSLRRRRATAWLRVAGLRLTGLGRSLDLRRAFLHRAHFSVRRSTRCPQLLLPLLS